MNGVKIFVLVVGLIVATALVFTCVFCFVAYSRNRKEYATRHPLTQPPAPGPQMYPELAVLYHKVPAQNAQILESWREAHRLEAGLGRRSGRDGACEVSELPVRQQPVENNSTANQRGRNTAGTTVEEQSAYGGGNRRSAAMTAYYSTRSRRSSASDEIPQQQDGADDRNNDEPGEASLSKFTVPENVARNIDQDQQQPYPKEVTNQQAGNKYHDQLITEAEIQRAKQKRKGERQSRIQDERSMRWKEMSEGDYQDVLRSISR